MIILLIFGAYVFLGLLSACADHKWINLWIENGVMYKCGVKQEEINARTQAIIEGWDFVVFRIGLWILFFPVTIWIAIYHIKKNMKKLLDK